MILCICLSLIPTWGLAASEPAGNTFYIDPVKGHRGNDGSAKAPWRTLQEVVERYLIETRAYASHPPQENTPLKVKNAGAPIKAGATLVLRSGHHGKLSLRGAYNTGAIVIRAEEGHRPTLSSVFLRSVAHWHLQGLTISPETGSTYQTQPLIRVESHGWHGPSSDVVIEDCNLYSVRDSDVWSKDDWNGLACNGISLSGDRMVVENNQLKNVNFGISVEGNHGRVSHNHIENFAGDGLRGLGNDLVFEYNRVKNCYNVNKNHDDGFQSWSIRDDPPRERIVLRGNTIINSDGSHPLHGPLQGIGCFDGPYIDWVVENNLVVVDHYHGISFYGAYNCRIVNNTVVDIDAKRPGPPAIRINPHKDKTPSANCLIRNNIASNIALSPGVTEDHNYLVKPYDELFVDPGNFDFHLLPTAPVIDAGSTELAPEVDLDEQVRPQGKGVDMGAYEWSADDVSEE